MYKREKNVSGKERHAYTDTTLLTHKIFRKKRQCLITLHDIYCKAATFLYQCTAPAPHTHT